MQGAGNDFIVFDNRQYNFLLDEIIAMTPKLCHRRFGAGADGVLVLQESKNDTDYRMIYRNADGSDAGMCGNGARCLARFAVNQGFPDSLSFMVHNQQYKAQVNSSEVTISFPVEPKPDNFIEINGYEALKVYPGTEHVVVWIENEKLSDESWLRECGRNIRYDSKRFPEGTNVNFISKHFSEGIIEMKTYERGVEDLTLACGTGALATAVSYHKKYFGGNPGEFQFMLQSLGGILKTELEFDQKSGSYKNLKLTGPADFVFEGTYHL